MVRYIENIHGELSSGLPSVWAKLIFTMFDRYDLIHNDFWKIFMKFVRTMFLEHYFPWNFRLIYAIYILIHKFYWRILLQVVNNNVVMMFKRNIWKEKMWLIDWMLSVVKLVAMQNLRWFHTIFQVATVGSAHAKQLRSNGNWSLEMPAKWIWVFWRAREE